MVPNTAVHEDPPEVQIGYRISLIHGTFARRAAWTKAGSRFREGLRRRLDAPVAFDTPGWRGRNRQLDRRAAGRRLAERLKSKDKGDGAKHFLVAHSHGGNVAMYAMEDPEARERVHGIVALNTPFLCTVPRNLRPFVVQGVLFALLWLTVVAITVTYSVIAMVDNASWPWWQKLLVAIPVVPAGAVAYHGGQWMWHQRQRIARATHEKIRERRDRVTRKIQLPSIRTPVLSTWTAGDEVASLFSFASGLSLFPYLFMHRIVFFILVPLALVGVVAGPLPVIDWYAFSPTDWRRHVWTGLSYVISAWMYVWLAQVAFLAFAVLVGLVLIVPVYGLGWRSIFDTALIRVFAAPVPIHSTNTGFVTVDALGRWLSHSEAYASDDALDEIATWIQEQAHGAGDGGG